MLKKTLPILGLAGLLGAAVLPAQAAEGVAVPKQSWSFQGVFGQFDRAELQRGFQVYRSVCAGCHGIKYVAFRNLADLGYNEDEIKAVAAEYEIPAGPNDDGEVLNADGEFFTRPGKPSDLFPPPFANDAAARAANAGALPPDLSLMAKARAGGADYIHALMVGYVDTPEGFEMSEGMNYNAYFAGHQIAMAQPLYGEDVEYADGTEASIEQQATDVSAFLMWTADPKLEERKKLGVGVILFLLIMTGVLYASKRKIWADQHH